jgi:hypothetical protein
MPERCVHTEVRTSTEFCTQHAMDLGYSPKARTKWNLEESKNRDSTVTYATNKIRLLLKETQIPRLRTLIETNTITDYRQHISNGML